MTTAAAGNGWSGRQVMELLLTQRESNVKVIERIIEAVAGNI